MNGGVSVESLAALVASEAVMSGSDGKASPGDADARSGPTTAPDGGTASESAAVPNRICGRPITGSDTSNVNVERAGPPNVPAIARARPIAFGGSVPLRPSIQ